MRCAILTGCDFTHVGGFERLILDTARALDGVVVSPHINATVAGRENIRMLDLGYSPITIPSIRITRDSMIFRNGDDVQWDDYDFFVCMDDSTMSFLSHDVPHMYYLTTPRRALYDMYYYSMSNISIPRKIMEIPMIATARYADRRFVRKHVKYMACISHTVRNRIQKVYLRDAEVIYPPTHTDKFKWEPSQGYWLSVGRVDKWKRIELLVDSFRCMPEKKLIVAGQINPEYEWLVRNAPDNVSFLGTKSEDEIINLYSQCSGVLALSIDEDYGYIPAEATASGKPIVAVREGGYIETVTHGINGCLVHPRISDVCNAVRAIHPFSDEYHSYFNTRCGMSESIYDRLQTYPKFVNKIRDVTNNFRDSWIDARAR